MAREPREIRIAGAQLGRGQWQFLHDDSPAVLLAGGFGSGKTTAVCLKILRLKTLNPRAPGLVMAQNWRSLWSVVWRRLYSITKKSGLLIRVRDKQGECFADFGDGVPVFLRSATHPDSFDGLDVGWAVGDELRHWPRHSYEVFRGRVRVKCPAPQAAFASTPAMHWMAEQFNSGREGHRLIRAPTSENIKHLRPGFIDDLRRSYSKRLQQAVVDGAFVPLEGSVFEAFDSDYTKPDNPWFADWDGREHKENRTYLAVDPGYRRSAWIVVQRVADLSWIVVDQIMPDDSSTEVCVNAINARKWPIDEIWVDPAAKQTEQASALSSLQVMRGVKLRSPTSQGLRVLNNSFRSIEYGIEKLRLLLGDPANGLPIMLRFSREVAKKEMAMKRGIIRDLAALRYPDAREGRFLPSLPVEDPVAEHSTDALRYWSVGMFLTTSLRLREMDSSMSIQSIGQGYETVA